MAHRKVVLTPVMPLPMAKNVPVPPVSVPASVPVTAPLLVPVRVPITVPVTVPVSVAPIAPVAAPVRIPVTVPGMPPPPLPAAVPVKTPASVRVTSSVMASANVPVTTPDAPAVRVPVAPVALSARVPATAPVGVSARVPETPAAIPARVPVTATVSASAAVSVPAPASVSVAAPTSAPAPAAKPGLPAGWNRMGPTKTGEVKFRTETAAGAVNGLASLDVVAHSRPNPGYLTAREERRLLAGVAIGDLRRIVIDKMISDGGWVTNDYFRDVAGQRVFIVTAQTPGDGRSPDKSWNFYFTEVNGRIYRLTTNTPQQFSERMATEAESFIASFHAISKPATK